MMSISDEIISAIENVSEAQRQLAVALTKRTGDKTAFSSKEIIPDSHQSLSDLDAQIVAMAQSIKGIAEQEDLTLVPLKSLQKASEILSKQADHYKAATTAIQASLPITSVDPATYSFTDNDGNRRSIATDLTALSVLAEDLLTDWHILRLSAKSPRINDFAAFVRLNSEHREALDKTSAELNVLQSNAQSAAQSVEATQERTKTIEGEVERLKSVADADRKTINDYLAEASTKIEGIREVSSHSTSLKTTIEEYETEFERFQSQLEERTRRHNESLNDLSKITERLTNEEKTIERLIAQSEGMLVGATNAGLAGSLSQRLNEVSKELRSARWSYYLAIAVLIAATIPIALDILPKELVQKLLKSVSAGYIDIGNSPDKPSPDLIGHVLARALLLIPPFLLVRFAAARHERLFRLREHYAYKFSIASSVEGFKQQSPEQYKDYIALTAFNELTFNPATQMEAKGVETKHPNPMIQAFLKKAGFTPENS